MGKRLIGIYFSATDTTRKYVESFAKAWSKNIDIEINLADNLSAQLPEITPEDLVIVAAPVYGGRLPSQVSSRLKELEGNFLDTYQVSVCSIPYGIKGAAEK